MRFFYTYNLMLNSRQSVSFCLVGVKDTITSGGHRVPTLYRPDILMRLGLHGKAESAIRQTISKCLMISNNI